MRSESIPVQTVWRTLYIIHLQHFKSYSIDTTYHNSLADDEVIGIHVEGYRSSLWLYVARKDELVVWSHKCHKRNTNNKVNRESQEKMVRSDSNESTLSERHFRRHYESVTHRMIHRRASIEMYRKAINNTFEIEKEIIINRSNSEFGFKIHGSRPVVVSAIEKNTPAETCGLDVGDIVVTINGYNVLESSHSDVVKLAHSGTNTLKLEVVSTRSALNCEENDVNNHEIVMSGYLIRFNNDSKTSKTYRNRWFVLKTDNCLYWYKSAKEMDPLGVISLHGYTAGEEQELTGEHPFGFRLVKLRSGVKYFASKDSNTVNQWVLAINQRADILHKCDPYIGLTIKNTSRSATSLTPNDCSGYLAIFSQRRKCWRNRYFVLKDAALYIYFGVDAKSSLGVFLLHGYKVQSCVLIGKKNTFEAIPSESKFRHLWLMAESDIDKKRWLSALEYSIDRWIKL
ncbi:uncharacterized protein LOC128961507 [Oppia nitens]|uniref:uncharacterized protein LOC128961507 n=1 Tax=Oppia nitens TaxID=1686743 RepID=UPI0023DBD912|nr:uncharacterized protein LOC128961507 [Oppia nitens]